MTKNRRPSRATLGRLRVCLSLLLTTALLALLIGGCGSKPKPSAPGYYTGPLEGKGGPAKNKAGAPPAP